MDSFGRLIISTIDNEKNIADFKKELSNYLEVNSSKIHVNVGYSNLHSVNVQSLIVDVEDYNSLSREAFELIPFDYLFFLPNNLLRFEFMINEGCI